MLALLIAVILLSDVLTLLNLAEIMILVLFLTVAHLKDAHPNQKIAMTKMHAPKIAV
jgi:hypothetical protein